MNKIGKAKELTLVGAIFLIIIGIILISNSASDPSGIVAILGWIFLICGVIALIASLIRLFKS